MKQNAGPIAIGAAVVVVIALLVVLYRVFFPPLPPADMDNPKGMPAYAKQAAEYIKAHGKDAPPPRGMPGQAQSQPSASSNTGQ
ncbi:MAG TPA: hypothetical protein VKU00_15125 [Chthonomonadaceae bacterium]|nr:hypothetical protein [Chthonomonadaceae bacterium]